MSIHYLINPFTTNGDITDVTTSSSGQTDATGSTIIRIPDGVAVHNNPSNLTDLVTEKYAALLAFYAGFPEVVGDPCLDALTVDLTASERILASAGFVNHCVLPTGVYASVSIPLAYAPTQCVVVWEEYDFVVSDDKTQRLQRTYSEASGSNFVCAVSFNGVNANLTGNGAVFNIPVAHQGSTFTIGLTNNAVSRKYLGSWALIY